MAQSLSILFVQVSPVNKERNVTRVKKKSALPATKASHISSPKVSKPSPAYTSLSASRSSKKGHDSSLPRSKTPSVVGSKKVAPKSLHMSIGLEPTNFEPSSHSTTRKSFIMEEMGDKDIVKRAFKTFQKNVNQLKPSVEERSLVAKQVYLIMMICKMKKNFLLFIFFKENRRSFEQLLLSLLINDNDRFF